MTFAAFLPLLSNKWVWIGLAIAAAAIGLVWFYYDAKAAGAATVIAAALAESARRATLANKARSEAHNAPMDQDPYNDDNHFGGR